MSTTATKPRLILKADVPEVYGIPEEMLTFWVRNKSIPFVQPAGPRGKVFFSTRLLDQLVRHAEGYEVTEPDFSEADPDRTYEGNDMTMVVPGVGAVHQSRRAEFERYQQARAEGKSVAEAIMAVEGL